jgi:NADH:ubiquinone oxidoreductase subunit F (NADH-binding)
VSTGRPQDTLEALRLSARERDSLRVGKTRVAVQVGHCSQSVRAGEVAEAVKSSVDDGAYVVIAGCDGACFEAPKVVVTAPSGNRAVFTHVGPEDMRQIAASIDTPPKKAASAGHGFFSGQTRISLDGCGEFDAYGMDDYVLRGGYGGLARSLAMTPEEVTDEVKASGLRGRGGAYFPAAAKWQSVRDMSATPKCLVVNAEEGEPGIFKDRHLMEGVPHRTIEGMTIAAYAAGVSEAYIYINAEAELSAERVQTAVAQAYEKSLLGENILGSGYDLSVEIRRGAGGYVCGEETTMLNTMEGYRREPRLRPPYPTEAGLWAKPTVINNVETLASVPYILATGAGAFAAIGSEKATGTKIISLSGSVRRPGIVEVPMGATLREIIYDIGGGPGPEHTLKTVAVGGPSSGVFPPSMLDTPIAPGLLHESGVMLGAGGVVVLDERMTVMELVRSLAAYNAAESCGKCTPCREGTPRMVDALDRLMSGSGSPADLDELRYLAQVVGQASLCGLGQAAGGPINSAMHFFGDEMATLAGVS